LARPTKIGADTDKKAEAVGALGATKRASKRDGLRDTAVTAELLHIPARNETPDAMANEVNSAVAPDLLDESGQALRDLLDASARRMREASNFCAGCAYHSLFHWPKHSCAREKSVYQHDHVVVRPNHLGHDPANVARHEHDFAKRGDGFVHMSAK